MAAPDQQCVLSTPEVYVDGVLWPIVPNSLEVMPGGESNVRAISAGGGAVQIVQAVDAETLKANIKFRVPTTAANVKRARDYRKRANACQFSTLRIADKESSSYRQVVMINNPSIGYAADGEIELEFEGTQAA